MTAAADASLSSSASLLVATTLRASVHVPDARGVYAARTLHAGVPLAILPTAALSAARPPPRAMAAAAETAADAETTTTAVLRAPPYVANLLRTPQHTISLRRLCALRHQFCSDRWLYVATPGGWYVLMPSTATALQDEAGLQSWLQQRVYGLAERWQQQTDDAIVGSGGGDEKGEGQSDDMQEKSSSSSSTSSKRRRRVQKQQLPRQLVIPEQHVFEINDAVPWPLPPHDDLASAAYWREHRARMQAYVDVMHGVAHGADEQHPPQPQQQQQPLLSSPRANVSVCIDDATGTAALLPLVNVRAGEELLLHYGREWWTQRLLNPLILAAADDDEDKDVTATCDSTEDMTRTSLSALRSLEALCAAPTDDAEPFPRLRAVRVAAAARRTRHARRAASAAAATPSSDRDDGSHHTTRRSGMFLYNASTRARATDAAALAYAVRRSCTHTHFFVQLLRGVSDIEKSTAAAATTRSTSCGRSDDGWTLSQPVFDVNKCDVEVPLRRLRLALLHSLCAERQRERHADDDGVVHSS